MVDERQINFTDKSVSEQMVWWSYSMRGFLFFCLVMILIGQSPIKYYLYSVDPIVSKTITWTIVCIAFGAISVLYKINKIKPVFLRSNNRINTKSWCLYNGVLSVLFLIFAFATHMASFLSIEAWVYTKLFFGFSQYIIIIGVGVWAASTSK
ncbi:hypothetical protein [Vibrio spartinae]|uniref:Intracellular septation protein A n=1 Tax=Vibrio spartinae TaxID=1918945 RepID=A0A1N6LZI0_9VIBR|nr:hypothetical protein [Vibrio spartinae]QMV16816.1 hypothetical protein Vspart_04228 [Vibrio spartinae]SIO92608.1 hypothetical protein VSP9026_00222 [Vibrio spartinae]